MNIAEILKDCPKGTKLYSPICGECELVEVIKNKQWIKVKDNEDIPTSFYANGTQRKYGECMLFPSKDNRDWSKFQRPFKDGDVLVHTQNQRFIMSIYHNRIAEFMIKTHCILWDKDEGLSINMNICCYPDNTRLATEEEKRKLFDVIKSNGYKWDSVTKTLEPKFKNGDVVVSGAGNIALFSHTVNMYGKPIIYYHCILPPICGIDSNLEIGIDCGIGGVEDCCLASYGQKERLFNALKEKGYKWNSETKTLEPIFKSGDVVVSSVGNIALFSHTNNEQIVYYHCILEFVGDFRIVETPSCGIGKVSNCVLATEEQKNRLFNKLKSAGYKWNPDTKTLEKLIKPNFKVGNKITNGDNTITIKEITLNYYVDEHNRNWSISKQNEWELIPDKFDISTLKPFESKVLVRDSSDCLWKPAIFGFSHRIGCCAVGGASWNQVIPYEGNEHLLKTNNDCDEYYKNW